MIEKNLNILLLEDQPADALMAKRKVKEIAPNCVFTVARNRAEFSEKLEWAVPDIVLADYNLPDMNGLEALLHIRENLPHLPFIFVSGTLNDEEKVAEAVLKGASGYVLKENLNALPNKLVEVLERAESDQAAAAERARQQREVTMAAQKALALLDKAPDFEKKTELKALINNILDHF